MHAFIGLLVLATIISLYVAIISVSYMVWLFIPVLWLPTLPLFVSALLVLTTYLVLKFSAQQ